MNPEKVEEQAGDRVVKTDGRVRVRVLFFGAARDAASDEVTLALDAPATARAVFEQTLSDYPELRRFGRSLLAPKLKPQDKSDEMAPILDDDIPRATPPKPKETAKPDKGQK